jgi:hypothetical protein
MRILGYWYPKIGMMALKPIPQQEFLQVFATVAASFG